MSNNKTFTEQNIELSAEFSRYLFEHPDLSRKLPDNAEIILLPEFDNALKEYNLKIGKKMESKGEKVIYISIKKLRSKILSRIEKIKLEPAI